MSRGELGLYNTRQLTKALLRQLVKQVRVRETDIFVRDGSARMIDHEIEPETHRRFAHRWDGEVVDMSNL